jgi:hypothetical protein
LEGFFAHLNIAENSFLPELHLLNAEIAVALSIGIQSCFDSSVNGK